MYRTVSRGHTFRQSKVRFPSIAYVCDGEATYTFGRHRQTEMNLTAGNVLVFPADVWREGTFTAETSRFFSIHVERHSNGKAGARPIWQRLMHRPAVLDVEHPGYTEALFWRIHQLKGRQNIGSFVEIHGLLMQIFGVLLQTSESKDAPPHMLHVVRQAEMVMLEHFDDPTLNVAHLAERFRWSPNYFSSAFKHVTGVTPIVYLRRVRLNHAMDLLTQDDLSIADVARLVGFDDPAYFSRVFRRVIGTPPSTWRIEQVHDDFESTDEKQRRI